MEQLIFLHLRLHILQNGTAYFCTFEIEIEIEIEIVLEIDVFELIL